MEFNRNWTETDSKWWQDTPVVALFLVCLFCSQTGCCSASSIYKWGPRYGHRLCITSPPVLLPAPALSGHFQISLTPAWTGRQLKLVRQRTEITAQKAHTDKTSVLSPSVVLQTPQETQSAIYPSVVIRALCHVSAISLPLAGSPSGLGLCLSVGPVGL